MNSRNCKLSTVLWKPYIAIVKISFCHHFTNNYHWCIRQWTSVSSEPFRLLVVSSDHCFDHRFQSIDILSMLGTLKFVYTPQIFAPNDSTINVSSLDTKLDINTSSTYDLVIGYNGQEGCITFMVIPYIVVSRPIFRWCKLKILIKQI